ncbi:MAG: DNA-directed RNA polymerase subunit B, partial [Dehalococcoidia bacterium]|nr:DNA-directed RNA polymerase subunit B [Dehalococcoidia bacterium]
PTSLFGHSTAAIPFSNHNQAPRNMYQTSMVKQAIAGRPSLVDTYRCDIHAHSLVYPMRPMVTTLGYEDTTTNGTGTGQEAIVAIMSYSGYNQEDSVLFNIHAAQRGLGDIFSTHAYRAELRQTGTEQEQFEIPDKNCTGKQNPEAYTHLSADGVVNVGAFVKGGDVLIGRTCTSLVYNQSGEQELSKIDRSVHLPRKPGVEGVVARVARYMSKDGNPSISIIIRQHRRVMRGDKWSSRHGQKGTVGRLVPAEDMPFSAKTGMIPDIVMNPHAIPSRMTIGHLMETLMGKAVAAGAIDGDATAFSGRDVEEIGDALEKSGYNRHGTEMFVDGRSGQQMEAAVFVGPIYYQRLSHLVEKKIHSRARTGPRAVLTRQPLEGRSKDGGLRFGEMERDSLLAHGAAFTQVDKMVTCSDEFSVYVCANCGTFASPPSTNAFRYKTEFRTKPMCTTCRTHDCKLAKIPYAFKLLTQELLAMGIVARMTLRPRDLST